VQEKEWQAVGGCRENGEETQLSARKKGARRRELPLAMEGLALAMNSKEKARFRGVSPKVGRVHLLQ